MQFGVVQRVQRVFQQIAEGLLALLAIAPKSEIVLHLNLNAALLLGVAEGELGDGFLY